jgi:ribonuclease D
LVRSRGASTPDSSYNTSNAVKTAKPAFVPNLDLFSEPEPVVTVTGDKRYETILTWAQFDAWLPMLEAADCVAIDTETMGLDPRRDRLCVVQLSDGKGDAHLVQIARGQTTAPNLQRLLTDPAVLKLFHFGRFDIAALQKAFGVRTAPVWCTKIASRLIRTYTDRHGLKYLLMEYVGVDVSKAQQTSDWGSATLTEAQKDYAASDVLYLPKLKAALEAILHREGRMALAQSCFDFLPTRAELDLLGWDEPNDLFHH